MRVRLPAAQEAGASTLDLGIIADAAGVEGLEQALDAAIARGADVLLTSGALTLRLHLTMFPKTISRECRVLFKCNSALPRNLNVCHPKGASCMFTFQLLDICPLELANSQPILVELKRKWI